MLLSKSISLPGGKINHSYEICSLGEREISTSGYTVHLGLNELVQSILTVHWMECSLELWHKVP